MHSAVMKTLTIRGVPDEVHKALKERARKNRRSLNQEVIAELAGSGEAKEILARREQVGQALARIDEIRGKMTRFMSTKEIDKAIEEGRR